MHPARTRCLSVTFFSFRAGGVLLGVAALKRLDGQHAAFMPCGPFADYSPSPNSAYMTLSLV
jgi:hypothetical protein